MGDRWNGQCILVAGTRRPALLTHRSGGAVDISPRDLTAQYERANRDWPFIHAVAAVRRMPPFLMHALGSRETNLRNIKGDFSQRPGESEPRFHGFGVWQRDIQHGIPTGWMDDVRAQCEWSADLLARNRDRCGSWEGACNAYNSGGCSAAGTAGGNYGPDVMSRRQWLEDHFPVPVPASGQVPLTRCLYIHRGSIHYLDPQAGLFTPLTHPNQVEALVAAGVANLGDRPDEWHEFVTNVAHNQGWHG